MPEPAGVASRRAAAEEPPCAGMLGAERRPTRFDRLAAALASARARSSASASEAASAARLSHLSASPKSPRDHMASAVESAHETSSGSVGSGGGIGTSVSESATEVAPLMGRIVTDSRPFWQARRRKIVRFPGRSASLPSRQAGRGSLSLRPRSARARTRRLRSRRGSGARRGERPRGSARPPPGPW